MPKANNKALGKKEIEKGFDDWEKLIIDLKEQAEKCYMPLLAKSFETDIAIIKTYRKAFLHTME